MTNLILPPQRISIAEMTPKEGKAHNTAGWVSSIHYRYPELNISWGVEAYDVKDFSQNSEKFRLIQYLAAYNNHTEVHLNDEALINVINSPNIEKSEIAQTLTKIKGLERVILNLDIKSAESFIARRPAELAQMLNFSAAANDKKVKTVVLLYNHITKDMVNGALKSRLGMDPIMSPDMGIMFCPPRPNAESYRSFMPVDGYDIKSYHLPLVYEYAGGLGSNNIHSALTDMARKDISGANITTRGGVMENKKLIFEKAEHFFERIRLWQQENTPWVYER